MSKELAELTDQETKFVEALFENGGKLQQAAIDSGYHPAYSYKLRDRLAKAITEASQIYLSMHSMKAAVKLVDSVDADMPNPVHLSAAQAVLDRVGIIKQNPTEAAPVIKANIFILPEKRYIDVTPE